MPIQIQWLIQGKVIYSVFQGDAGQDYLKQWANDLNQMLESGDEAVYLLNNLSQISTDRNIDLATLRETLAVMRTPRLKWSVTYGQHTHVLMRFLASALSQIMGYRVKMFETREDAIDFIHALNPALDLNIPFAEFEKPEQSIVE